MADNHPITPPPELFKQCEGMPRSLAFEAAYRAGADQELEACCEWLQDGFGDIGGFPEKLRAARRPKPPSLKEQALSELDSLENMGACNADTIRRALEQLDD